MNFADFLKQRRAQLNIATVKEHYENLGGEKKLQISLRHFQQIESGKFPPSEHLFAVLFEKARADDRRNLVLAYFKSAFRDESPGGRAVIEYLENHLTPGFETEKNSIWESGKPFLTYTAEQLDYLITHPEALQFHRKILLIEECAKAECTLAPKMLRELGNLELIEIRGNKIEPSGNMYRAPKFGNSTPKLVAKASDFILKLQETYVAREGSPNQELSYAMQMVRPEAARRILDQMVAFKKWVQSMASRETGPGVSPLLFVGFAKIIDRNEL